MTGPALVIRGPDSDLPHKSTPYPPQSPARHWLASRLVKLCAYLIWDAL